MTETVSERLKTTALLIGVSENTAAAPESIPRPIIDTASIGRPSLYDPAMCEKVRALGTAGKEPGSDCSSTRRWIYNNADVGQQAS